MKIKYFNKLLAAEARHHVLRDCNLVIDAQNYFYNMYEQSKLSKDAGCESDKFSNFLKKKLKIFKKANIKCYFVFKGGSKDVEKRWQNYKNKEMINQENLIAKIFVKDICRQTLEEMGFDYVICQLEAKEQCAVLANKLGCPVLSNDIEVAILSDSYINSYLFQYDPFKRGIKCKLLRFSNVLKKYGLSSDIFPSFILLTDHNIYPDGYFSKILQKIKAPIMCPDRYIHIFKWLSRNTKSEILKEILEGFDSDEKKLILLKEKEIRALLAAQSPGIPCQYFLERNKMSIVDNDPQWFEKGIALRYIAIPYVNLYTDGVTDGCWRFHNDTMPDAVLLSTDIMKYALNLLSNYSKESFIVHRDNGEKIAVSTKTPDVPKPNYTTNNVVFENGWGHIERYNLFNHFLNFTLKGINFDPLQDLPRSARILMVALIYMAYKSESWGKHEAYSVLLSYVALCCSNNDITAHDRQTTNEALAPYMIKTNSINNNQSVLYPLIQFQHCLEQMNYLNALCGRSYEPTVYSQTFNGLLVYNILEKLNDSKVDAFVQISQLLKSSPTVVSIFKKLVDTHKKMIPFKN